MEEVLGHRFKRPGLLQEALTHKSFSFERGGGRHNERLEFLGDSVLACVVAHHLFERYPEEDEGGLSKAKAALVSRAALARWAQALGLGQHLFLGAGEDATGGRSRVSLLANVLEALIGAIYLDGGYRAAADFVRRACLDIPLRSVEADHKSRLQEIVQKRYKVTPEYGLVKTSGPDHDRTFSVKVQLGSKVLGQGQGKSKKEAEQAAALDALERLALQAGN